MPIDPLAFLDEPSEISSSNQSDPLSFLDETPKGIGFPKIGFGRQERSGESQVPQMKRTLGRTGKVVGSTIAGIPGDIASSVGSGLNWLAGKVPGGKPKSEEELKGLTENPFTSHKIQEGIESLNPNLKAKNSQEKEWEENLGLITSLATPGPTGKAKALDPRHSSKIYKAGKALGFTEKELTPLIQGTAKENILGKIAKKTKGLKEAIETTGNKISSVYDDITDQASKLPNYDWRVSERLAEGLSGIKNKLEKTLKAGPSKQTAITFLEDAIKEADSVGSSPEKLINFFFDINDTIPWKSVKNGTKRLVEAKKVVMDTLSDTYPQIASHLKEANILKSKLHGFEKAVGLPKIAEFISHDKSSKLITQLALGAVGSSALGLVGGAKALAASEAIRRVATRMLTDPKWQNLHGKILTAIKNKTPDVSRKLLQVVKKMAEKDMPEDSKEIDWEM